MRKKLNLAVAILFIVIIGFINQTVFPVSDVTEEYIENQLQIILDNYIWPSEHYNDAYAYYRYAVTDLDQNERLEFISTIQQGSGKYTDSYYYEINESLIGLTDLKMTKLEESGADIVVDSVPVYYDLDNNIYYYIFNDVLKDGINRYYENKRAISLKNGKLSEYMLAYKTTWYKENSSVPSPSVSYKDLDGNEISENEYNCIADITFPDFVKKEAYIYWFDIDLNNLNDSVLKPILRKSYNGFLIQ